MESTTLTPEEVSQALGLGINQVYNALKEGQIPHHRIGRRYVIPRAMFERWLSGEPVHTSAGVAQRAAA